MITAGIDIGSTASKAVVLADGERVGFAIGPSSTQPARSAREVYERALSTAGVAPSAIGFVVGTGYGRARVEFADTNLSEITCHGRGAHHLWPDVRTVIDIGGQDVKAIRVDPDGNLAEFVMNDKCAAGTGRFLEAMARALEVEIEELAELDRGATSDLALSSMCTVFAESEVVSLVADGVEVREIVAGLNRAVATRVRAMVNRIAPDLGAVPVAMSGGVAYNGGVVRALESSLGVTIAIPTQPDTVGALGAALTARSRGAA